QKSKRVQTLDLDDGTLDARFFPIALIEYLRRVSLPLRPSLVHAHEHRGPVLSFGPARAGTDLELGIAEVVLPRKERPQTKSLQLLGKGRDLAIQLASQLLVRIGRQHDLEILRAAQTALDLLEGIDPSLQRFHLLHDRLGGLLVAPESR